MEALPSVILPVWQGSRYHAAGLLGGATTLWSIDVAASFDLVRRVLRPGLLLVPHTEPGISSARLADALAHGGSKDVLGQAPEPNCISIGKEMRFTSLDHWVVGLHDPAPLSAWRTLGERRAPEVRKARTRARLQVLLRAWRTTAPWALLTPEVNDALVERLSRCEGLDDITVALQALELVLPKRARPSTVPSLQFSHGLLKAIRRHLAALGGVGVEEAMRRLLPKKQHNQRSIESAIAVFDAKSERLIVQPLFVPSKLGTALPLADLARLVGRNQEDLVGLDLMRVLVAPGRSENVEVLSPWPREMTLPADVEGPVVRMLVCWTCRALRCWLSSPDAAGMLRVVAGGRRVIQAPWWDEPLASQLADLVVPPSVPPRPRPRQPEVHGRDECCAAREPDVCAQVCAHPQPEPEDFFVLGEPQGEVRLRARAQDRG